MAAMLAGAWVKGILRDQEKKDKTMTNDFTTTYASILKYDENDDGTLTGRWQRHR
jgi:hypothetical protein